MKLQKRSTRVARFPDGAERERRKELQGWTELATDGDAGTPRMLRSEQASVSSYPAVLRSPTYSDNAQVAARVEKNAARPLFD